MGSAVRRYILPQALTAGPSSADLLSQYRVPGTEAEEAPGGSGSSSGRSSSSGGGGGGGGGRRFAPRMPPAPDVPSVREESRPAAAAAEGSPAPAPRATAAARPDAAAPLLPGAEVFVLARQAPGPAPAQGPPLMRFSLEVEGAPLPCIALFQVRRLQAWPPRWLPLNRMSLLLYHISVGVVSNTT